MKKTLVLFLTLSQSIVSSFDISKIQNTRKDPKGPIETLQCENGCYHKGTKDSAGRVVLLSKGYASKEEAQSALIKMKNDITHINQNKS